MPAMVAFQPLSPSSLRPSVSDDSPLSRTMAANEKVSLGLKSAPPPNAVTYGVVTATPCGPTRLALRKPASPVRGPIPANSMVLASWKVSKRPAKTPNFLPRNWV